MVELDYGAVADGFAAERPLLQEFVDLVVSELKSAILGAGIYAAVTGRVKEVDSFTVKALVGHRYRDPLHEIGDKAGVRVVVPYLRDVEKIEQLVRKLFVVIKEEQKLDALGYNENGYLGLHLDVRLHDEQTAADAKFSGLRLEIQVRTIAQGAWAEVTHDHLYKPPGLDFRLFFGSVGGLDRSPDSLSRKFCAFYARSCLLSRRCRKTWHARAVCETEDEGAMTDKSTPLRARSGP